MWRGLCEGDVCRSNEGTINGKEGEEQKRTDSKMGVNRREEGSANAVVSVLFVGDVSTIGVSMGKKGVVVTAQQRTNWSARSKTVLREKCRLQSLKRSSSEGPSKSMTMTLIVVALLQVARPYHPWYARTAHQCLINPRFMLQ